ncbi:MAG: hypothetical protein HQM09_24585 [Candidatus Riflebacteria bacterium]|nr:hypothetical protein [Candidatus Riflebacteria bacterium]
METIITMIKNKVTILETLKSSLNKGTSRPQFAVELENCCELIQEQQNELKSLLDLTPSHDAFIRHVLHLLMEDNAYLMDKLSLPLTPSAVTEIKTGIQNELSYWAQKFAAEKAETSDREIMDLDLTGINFDYIGEEDYSDTNISELLNTTQNLMTH